MQRSAPRWISAWCKPGLVEPGGHSRVAEDQDAAIPGGDGGLHPLLGNEMAGPYHPSSRSPATSAATVVTTDMNSFRMSQKST